MFHAAPKPVPHLRFAFPAADKPFHACKSGSGDSQKPFYKRRTASRSPRSRPTTAEQAPDAKKRAKPSVPRLPGDRFLGAGRHARLVALSRVRRTPIPSLSPLLHVLTITAPHSTPPARRNVLTSLQRRTPRVPRLRHRARHDDALDSDIVLAMMMPSTRTPPVAVDASSTPQPRLRHRPQPLSPRSSPHRRAHQRHRRTTT